MNYTSLFQDFLAHTNEKSQAREALLKCFSAVEYDRLLDFGCGTGEFTQVLLPYFRQVVALDQENRLVPEVLNNPKVKFTQTDFLQYQDTEKFDCILAAYVLWEIHPEKWPRVFEKLKGLLNREGFLIVIDVAQPLVVDNHFFSFDTDIEKLDFVREFDKYLNKHGWRFEKHRFTSQIFAADAFEMYEVLKFFFQGDKREKFYLENREKILADLKNKIQGNQIVIDMTQEIYLIRLRSGIIGNLR